MSGRCLSHAAKRSKTIAFCFFSILYTAKRSETTTLLVSPPAKWSLTTALNNFLAVPVKK
jgi:hypothetical protein